jgi:hypothetical protein
VIPKRVAAGNAQLVVALEDAAGNAKTARRTVKVPTA